MSPELQKFLRKRIKTALDGRVFPPLPLPPLEGPIVERTIERIGVDDRLSRLFARIDEDESLRRTFLSVYFQVRRATP